MRIGGFLSFSIGIAISLYANHYYKTHEGFTIIGSTKNAISSLFSKDSPGDDAYWKVKRPNSTESTTD